MDCAKKGSPGQMLHGEMHHCRGASFDCCLLLLHNWLWAAMEWLQLVRFTLFGSVSLNPAELAKAKVGTLLSIQIVVFRSSWITGAS